MNMKYTKLETEDSPIFLPEETEDANYSGAKKPTGTYAQVFDCAGFGKWQILLLFQCGWANASDAIEIMCISFTMSSMHESLKISNERLTSLTFALFLGMMIGGYLWGSLADTYGRRRVVVQSLFINSIFSALSAFSQQLWVIILFRFLSGVGAGGSLPVCFSYFSEFQPKNRRGAMISLLATFWMAGNIVAAGLAWLILPSQAVVRISPSGEPWRLFILLCSVPSFTSALFFHLMPESPLYLAKSGETAKAFLVLTKVFKWNHGKDAEMPYSGMFDEDDAKIERNFPSARVSMLSKIVNSVTYQWKVMFSLEQGRRRRSLALSCACFSIAFSYGLSMWIPTLLERAENSSGSPCQAPPLNTSNLPLVDDNKTTTNNNDGTNPDIYIDVFIGSAAQLPANLLAIVLIDRVGGKPILVFGYLMTAAVTLMFYASKNKTQIVIVNALFNCGTTIVFDAVDVIIPELYETRVRASANGFLTAWSRVAALAGNAVMGLFIDTNCGAALVVFSVVFLAGAISSLFLPNTRGVDLG